ncbi:alkylglycerol monooxygenase-like [Penaeus japonicus]|uniref:alkylglycerol monooxygenase-like n=1 Tax=Penaeus japonicus TaxID=27405 RepID=UPI001C710EA5|nr:alkylglycerol monooxygenase-like [Penaeus japonicus]
MNTSAPDPSSWAFSLRANFYALSPGETYYENVWQVPNMVAKALPVMVLMSIIEAVILKVTNRDDKWRLHVAVLNYSTGSLSEAINNFILRGAELSAYIWVYNNWGLIHLAWDSVYTYFVALLGVEFCFYWWHRASHETAVMWAAHSTHHSSEDFNMTVTARTSWTMRPFKWIFFLPLAFLGLPPPVFLIHQQLSYVYAGWTHNETVPKLGKVIPGLGHVIEFVFLTPSHHRVHHGANKYCIDKNYGQTFIIFDRIFGTFAEEREDEPLVYGTLSQSEHNSAITINISPWVELWRKVQSMTTFGDKVRALVYGPGWTPGDPRLGDPAHIPDVRKRQKVMLSLPPMFSVYMTMNSALVFFSYMEMMGRIKDIGPWLPLVNSAYIFVSYTALGGLYEGRRYGAVLEIIRLLLFFVLSSRYPMFGSATTIKRVSWINLLSLLLWPLVAIFTFRRAEKNSKIEMRPDEAAKKRAN